MHALNIMWLLNKVDCNTEVEILTGKSKHYIITYDDFNDSFLCAIDGETISANFVGEILSYIAKLYDHTPSLVYSNM